MQIDIEQLQISVRVGCTKEERAFPQILTCDLALSIGDESSLHSDSLKDTVDYMLVIDAVRRIAEEREFSLLEHFVSIAGQEVLSLSEIVTSVFVKATKKIVPETKGIAVSATISR